jgi:hypothetical protein
MGWSYVNELWVRNIHRIIVAGDSRNTGRQHCPCANLSTTNPILIGQGLSVGVRGERMTKNHIGHVTALCLMDSDAVLSCRYPPTFRMNLLAPSSEHSLIFQAKLQGKDMRGVEGVQEAKHLPSKFGQAWGPV